MLVFYFLGNTYSNKQQVLAAQSAEVVGQQAAIKEQMVTTAALSDTQKPVTKVATAQSTKVKPKTKVLPKTKVKPKPISRPSYYKVKRGDTLFSISQKFYGSRSGERKIKRANGLLSNKVMTYQTLYIPK